jgi:hypothetical protein
VITLQNPEFSVVEGYALESTVSINL